MLGMYLAYAGRAAAAAAVGFWRRVLLPPLAVGVLGALIEMLLLRRLYRAPELLQLLATFALVLVDQGRGAVALGPGGSARAARAGPAGAVEILGRRFPSTTCS